MKFFASQKLQTLFPRLSHLPNKPTKKRQAFLYLSRRNWANSLWFMPLLVRKPTGSIPFWPSESLFFFFFFLYVLCWGPSSCCFGCSEAEHKTFVFFGKETLLGPFGDWKMRTELLGYRESLGWNESEVMVNIQRRKQ